MSADALQVYRGLEILTAQSARPTRLAGIRELGDEMSVGKYAPLAHAAIDELVATTGSAVVAGGTGLYVRAALVDLAVPPASSPRARAEWEARYDADPGGAYAELVRLDPPAAARVHPNDRRRVVRALELAAAGASLSPREDRLWSEDMRRPTLVLGLDVPADVLERRIRARLEEMFARGVVAEARRAHTAGLSRTAARALGLADLLERPPDEAFERVHVRTRRYAAYQRKWMRRIPGIVMIDADRPPEQVVDAILEVARPR